MRNNILGVSKRALAAAALVVGLGAAVTAREIHASNNPPANVRLADPREGPSKASFAPIVKRVLPAVVNISTSKVVKAPTSMRGGGVDPLFRQFFGEGEGPFAPPRDRREQSLGSGVIVTPEGYILTNNHVVDGATDIRVTLSNKSEYKARLIGADPRTDIALLKIDAGSLPAVTISDSSKVEVGDIVLAIGNPFGVGQTVTSGIVSATGRGGLGIEDYEDFIQTDAAINPGNSGGALINDRGELIGINTAILSRAGGNQGIGFAIPSNLARGVMTQLVDHGKVTRAYLGIVPQDVTPAIAKAFNVKELRGALVGDVTPDSPASRAGIEKGDIILEVNGKAVTDANQLRLAISMMPPEQAVNLKVLRNGSERSLTARLTEFPVREERASAGKPDEGADLHGLSVDNLDAGIRRELQLKPGTQGVVVTAVDPASAAAAAGVRRGDVIQEVNRKPVRNIDDFARAMKNTNSEALLLLNRQGNTLFVAV
jgi:serine protease Do